MTATSRAVIVVLLVALAGCSFTLDTGATTSPTPTPGVQQETPNATPTSEEASPYPPGVDGTTIQNVSALLEAHTAALNETGYVANGSGDTTIRRSGFLVDVTRDVRVGVTSGSERYYEVRRTNAGPVDRFVQRYSNGSVEFRRFEENGNVEFREREPQSAEKLARVDHLDSFLRGGDFEVIEVRDDEEPSTVLLQANRSDNETALLSGLPSAAERVRSYDATVRVDSAGRVRWLNATVGFVIGGQNRTHTVAFNLTRIGVSNVSRPDWVDERIGERDDENADSPGDESAGDRDGERIERVKRVDERAVAAGDHRQRSDHVGDPSERRSQRRHRTGGP